ncbi:putative ABC transport system ATP-binding protein [Xanthomonas arboricola]|uniref:ABC transporter ATP-binding protein n=1 Tax=Xanthomonas euroxanthea TaxID=2259622 RepID=UPI00141BA86F|nr:ABC transporter ATP-binding protein [Xanthomonas euroxanthea]NIK40900.1 putative ABC transport system ATP-binding protein [Xanthomonas euroxanthea]
MIELQGVSRRYAMNGQTVHALAGIDLTVATGEFVAVTGRSGSGKSSLLNILGCLDHPSSGCYLIDGCDVANLNDADASDIRNRRIGFVFQSFHLLPRLTVRENVLLPLRFHRDPPAGAEARADTLLYRVGLSQRRDHLPGELSGGQIQRAAIARALLLEPALLLADEPTGNLDSKSAADVLALIDEVHRGGQTVVMVTHDAEIAAHAPRQVRLRDGRIEHNGAVHVAS